MAGSESRIMVGRGPNGEPLVVSLDATGAMNTAAGATIGAVTIADGADVAQGALADVEVAAVGPASVIAILKRLRTLLTPPVAVGIAAAQVAAGAMLDGSDSTQGFLADAPVITDVAGTISGKLRGLVKWAFERMPASLGQKTKLLSLPVTLASDEDALAVTGTFFPVTQPVSLAVAPSTPVTGPIDIEVGGVPPQLDDTDKIAVSLYGKDSAAGDKELSVSGAGNLEVIASGPFTAVLSADAIAASTMYQIIDLSDAANYPHTATNQLILKRIRLNCEKDTIGIFRVKVGIVIENDGTDGSATWLHTFHLEANGNPTDGTDRFAQEHTFNLDCQVSAGALVNYVSNDVLAANALLKNDVARTSPVGTGNPGAGDLMVYVEEITDGGTIDVTISADYDTV